MSVKLCSAFTKCDVPVPENRFERKMNLPLRTS